MRLAPFLSAIDPAAFGRLCVETQEGIARLLCRQTQPPSGGCVLKLMLPSGALTLTLPSRLRAAVC